MKKQTIGNIGLGYGAVTAGALILFFFLMLLTGWIYYYELRALNYIFLFAGVFLALKKYRENIEEFAYLSGLGIGIITSAVALFIFSVFVVIYLLIDAEFMRRLKEFEYFGQYLNPYIAGVAIFFEGTFSGILTSFILMQYYKNSHLKKMEEPLP